MEYDNCCAAMGMITEIFDTETVKWERRKPFPPALTVLTKATPGYAGGEKELIARGGVDKKKSPS